VTGLIAFQVLGWPIIVFGKSEEGRCKCSRNLRFASDVEEVGRGRT